MFFQMELRLVTLYLPLVANVPYSKYCNTREVLWSPDPNSPVCQVFGITGFRITNTTKSYQTKTLKQSK